MRIYKVDYKDHNKLKLVKICYTYYVEHFNLYKKKHLNSNFNTGHRFSSINITIQIKNK